METAVYKRTVQIPVNMVNLPGDLVMRDNAAGIVIFSHGSGSSRLSPRNIYVARKLQDKGFATLLFDLLTEEEGQNYELYFDIPLLSRRLESVTKWVMENPYTKGLEIGFFGASTGAASALSAASHLENHIKALVSRGGRPDLVMKELLEVKTPTLLIVGGLDKNVISLNRGALRHLAGERKLSIVEEATHLFNEQGKLDEVAVLAANWFEKYLK